MSYHNQLVEEIHSILDGLAERRENWDATWVAHEVCQSHKDGLSADAEADFWRHCGYAQTRDMVRRCISERAEPPRPEALETERARQYVLPGFDHIRTHYLVERDGTEVGVFVYSLTDEEIEAKASQYRKMGAACYAHANELDRFRELRLRDGGAVA